MKGDVFLKRSIGSLFVGCREIYEPYRKTRLVENRNVNCVEIEYIIGNNIITCDGTEVRRNGRRSPFIVSADRVFLFSKPKKLILFLGKSFGSNYI